MDNLNYFKNLQFHMNLKLIWLGKNIYYLDYTFILNKIDN